MFVKVFEVKFATQIEEVIQTWLDENQSIRVIAMSQTATPIQYVITIIYSL